MVYSTGLENESCGTLLIAVDPEQWTKDLASEGLPVDSQTYAAWSDLSFLITSERN